MKKSAQCFIVVGRVVMIDMSQEKN